MPTTFGMDGRVEGYRQGSQLGSHRKCPEKREGGRTCWNSNEDGKKGLIEKGIPDSIVTAWM